MASLADSPALLHADRLRATLIRATGPLGRTLAARRDLRVAAMGLGSVSSGLALATVAPAWMAVLGPATLGVAHLVADVRYLVIRPGLHRDGAFWRWVGVPAGLALLTSHPAIGLVAIGGGAAMSAGPGVRRLAVAALGVAAVLWALGDVRSLGVIAQLHNPFAIAMWWAWRKDRRPVHLAPVAAYVVGSVLLLSGALDDALRAGLALSGAPEGVWQVIAFLGLGLPGPWPLRLVAWASFGQVVHYGMWLRCIPEDDRDRESARSVRRQLRELVDDVGWAGVGLTVAATVVLLALVPISPLWAREAYFVVAPFHPYLEFGVAALWAAGGAKRVAAFASS